MKSLAMTLVAVLALSSCYKASIHLTPPQPTTMSALVENEMHLSLIGLIELSDPINLETACPGGVVTIEERLSFVGGLVNLLLGTVIPVLQVMTPTAMCGRPMGAIESETPQHASR